ncbi:hypothetical protein GCM10010495_39660 [Kitasatospora herbaricolor]|nr:hypothetical protein GCM10010495_39660 [Kitasatospora herbaricolor]
MDGGGERVLFDAHAGSSGAGLGRGGRPPQSYHQSGPRPCTLGRVRHRVHPDAAGPGPRTGAAR